MFCPYCGAEQPQEAVVCTACGATLPVQQEAPAYAVPLEPIVPAKPMKWYKFLIYFALWASAVLNLYSAVQQFLGLAYGTDAELIYATYPLLKSIDIAYGVILVGLAILAIVARFRLAKFCKNGPTLLYTLYALNLVMSIVYLLGCALVLAVGFAEVLSQVNVIYFLISPVLLLVLNIIYFNKRRELFINE